MRITTAIEVVCDNVDIATPILLPRVYYRVAYSNKYIILVIAISHFIVEIVALPVLLLLRDMSTLAKDATALNATSTSKLKKAPEEFRSYDSYEQELKELKAKTNSINQQSLASTQRILDLVTQCQDVSAKSLGMLYYQEEKINGTEDGLDEIHSNLLESGKHLKRMSKLDCLSCLLPCQNFLCCWRTKCSKGDNNIEDEDYEEGHQKSSSKWHLPRFGANGVTLPGGKKQPEPSFIPRITNDESEAVMEKNIAQTSKDISVLRDQAIDIVNSIKSQQAQLNRWQKKAETDEEKMAAAVQQTTHLLKSSSNT